MGAGTGASVGTTGASVGARTGTSVGGGVGAGVCCDGHGGDVVGDAEVLSSSSKIQLVPCTAATHTNLQTRQTCQIKQHGTHNGSLSISLYG